MKTVLTLSLFIIAFGQGCKDQKGLRRDLSHNSVNIVKNAAYNDGTTIEMSVASIVGITGKVKWTAFQPSGYESHVRIVEVNISRTLNRKRHSAKVQWIVNMDTKYVKIEYIEIDGETVAPFMGMGMINLMWPIESGGLF